MRDSSNKVINRITPSSLKKPLKPKFGSKAFQLASIVVSMMLHGLVCASTPDDIGTQQFLRQQEQERALRERQEVRPDVHVDPVDKAIPASAKLDAKPLSHDETPCFPIKEIQLMGEEAEHFQWAISQANLLNGAGSQSDPAIGHCLGTAGIDIVMTRIQRAIIDRGFVTTRVMVAKQNLTSGTLTLTLIPGRIHTIRFEEGTNSRAKHWNAMPMKRGDLLNVRDIEQALENFQRLPTVTADIKITPAAAATPDESDLVISWKQPRLFRLSAFADDSGSRMTGKFQGGVTLSIDDPLALNDLFYVTFNHDLGGGMEGERGTRGQTWHYSIPYQKWLLSTTYSTFHYHQSLPGAFKINLYSGESDNTEIKLSRLLYRSRALKTSAAMRLWSRQARNFVDNNEMRTQQRRMAGWEASISQRAFIQTATFDISVAYRRGTGMLNTLTALEENNLVPTGSSRPQMITAETTLTIPFKIHKQSLQYQLNARGQWNKTLLVPQDRFSIGSRYSVRGFDGETTLTGERGYFVRNELSWVLGSSRQSLYTGIDYGQIGGPSSRKELGTRLMGGTIGLRGSFKGFTYDLFASHPFKHPEYFHASSTVAGFSASYQY